ncbi:hypothetical protein LPTSP4_20180 [Leptospira ryugenii]|uniref:Bacterial surface antigen (D15) domain-containing protein n=1 Tax=Leptospira ryugenii TaxID=1917863 RepID=A0A2P2E0U7_9LEPT|nr:hypothetical protein [Leptospira ryugenii]GBF50492.1 hypothetical protein LPTSP4_20180 [Leptospira ryugenii]
MKITHRISFSFFFLFLCVLNPVWSEVGTNPNTDPKVPHAQDHSNHKTKDPKTNVAQAPDPNSPAEEPRTNVILEEHPKNLEPMQKFNQVYEHRLMVRGGWGIGKLSPGILNETGQAWLINSFFRQTSEPGAPLVLPYKSPKDLNVDSQFWDIRYGYKNKFEIQMAEDTTLGVYSRDLPASNEFFSPRSGNYWASAFEGNRLLRFEGVSSHLRFSYTHPLSKIFMIGPSLNFHRYTERNNITYGSYSSSRQEAPVPGKTTWSIGGDANAEYSMKGILPGIYTKIKLRDWWELRGRVELMDRKGDFTVLGSQIIQESFIDGSSNFAVVLPAYGGTVRDKGYVFNIESSFRYCRFTLDIGIIRQDLKRTYPLYLGDTVGSVPRTDYSARSIGLGVSEMSNSIKHQVTEFYIMPGVSFFYDADGVY